MRASHPGDTTLARVDRSTAWVAVASVVLGVMDAVSTILCLRIGVTVAELGAATLAVALFPIVDRLGGLGLTAAVIRETETDPGALSSVFWLGLGATAALLGVLALARPLALACLPDPIIWALLFAYTGRQLVRHFSIVPEAMMKRDLRYRELARVKMVGSFAETAVKIGFAYMATHGGGPRELAVWCFILGPIANAIVTTIGTLICHPWRPHFVIRREVAVRAARFTAAVSGGELLYFAYTSADYLVVGAFFGDAAVGVYRLAYELVLDVVRLLSLVTTEVAFPTFARISSDIGAVGAQLIRFTRQNLIVIAPFLVYAGIEADDLLALLFGVNAPAAATAARVLCIVGAVRALGFIVPSMLAGIGRAAQVLVYNAFAAVLLPVLFVVAALLAPRYGYLAVAGAWAAGYPIAFGVLLAMALPAAELSTRTYFRSLAGIVACAAGGLIAGLGMRFALPGTVIVRVIGVASVVFVVYGVMLARIEGVTILKVVRRLRADPAA
ncbi:MAG TPA: oligosaccharide flippase family protein [Kofleriaceae bacterium]